MPEQTTSNPPVPRWLDSDLPCVIMCGGNSSRFASSGSHKSMARVNDLPVISHVINYWRAYTNRFIFVVKNGKQEIIDYVSTLDINSTFVEPQALRGIADGLSYVEPLVNTPFIVVLGDCFCAGSFDLGADFHYGIGVLPGATPAQVRRNYAVKVEAGRVVGVEEKPAQVLTEHCGMGFYFLQPEVFEYLRRTAPSPRSNELEITDVLQTLIDDGVDLWAVMLDGYYVNVTSPSDLELIAEALNNYS